MLCALATLVTVPVLIVSGASSDSGSEIAIVVPDASSASELQADVDIDDLFDAGAKLDDVPEMDIEERAAAADLVAAAPQSLIGDTTTDSRTGLVAETPESLQDSVTSTTISNAPATPAPAPTTTEATATTTTEAPTTTAAPVTAAPVTEAPVTEAPSTTVAAEPVVEEPQAAEASVEAAPGQPTAEQWAALRQCEASGNYSIVSGNGLYHGAYQFYQPTWDGLANQVGRTDLVGVAPSAAAPSDQDALALLLWQQRGSQPWPHCGVHLPSGS